MNSREIILHVQAYPSLWVPTFDKLSCNNTFLMPLAILLHIDHTLKTKSWSKLGSYHFLPGGRGCLFVIAGLQFVLAPPWHAQKNSGPPLGMRKKF